jgi:predicted nucleotidyltransferase
MQQNQPTIQQLKELSSQLPEKLPYLKMLILFGSRATGETHDDSDWDFATLYDPNLRQSHSADNPFKGFEFPLILNKIFGINSDIIDIVKLNTCPSGSLPLVRGGLGWGQIKVRYASLTHPTYK